MKERLKEQYEAPATKRTRVEMENGICATSTINVNPGEDIGRERHVDINRQENGGSFEATGWDGEELQ